MGHVMDTCRVDSAILARETMTVLANLFMLARTDGIGLMSLAHSALLPTRMIHQKEAIVSLSN